MNAKLPDPPRRPRGDGVRSPGTVPSAPVGGVQGDRLPLSAPAGGTPAGEGGSAPASSPAGPPTPGGAAGTSGSGLLAPPGAGPRRWIVALPAGLETLSLNGRLHWSQQRKRAAELKKAAWAIALRQKIPHLDSISVLVVYHPPDRRRRDHDNIPPASGKHAIDGLVAAKVLDDDCPPNVASVSYAIGEIVKGGQLVLHITEAVPGGRKPPPNTGEQQ